MEKTFYHQDYFVRVIYKKIKNTYLRVNQKQVIITTNYRTKEKTIKDFINDNKKRIEKMLASEIAADKIYYQGQGYEKVKMSGSNKIEFFDNKVIYANEKQLDLWYRKKAFEWFLFLLQDEYKKVDEKIAFPEIKIRKMKTRWGVCNRSAKTITLNLDLMRFDEKVIRYVIIHELIHFLYPYHNQIFWKKVAFYCPDYQKLRKKLRN